MSKNILTRLDEKIAKKKQELVRAERKLARFRISNYKKITYAYGNWAIRCCNFPFENPSSVDEVIEDVNVFRNFLGLNTVTKCAFNMAYYKDGFLYIVLGVELKELIQDGTIKVPHPFPQYKPELAENISVLHETFPSIAIYDDYDFSTIPSDKVFSLKELHSINFPFNRFNVPQYEVSFSGVLVARMWSQRNPMLVCFFIADDGCCYSLNTWWKGKDDRDYRPSKDSPCFANAVKNGTRWNCTVTFTSSGNVVWSDAVAIT